MRSERVVQRRAHLACLSSIALVVALVFAAGFAHANGGDLPPQILLQGFVKPEDGRLELFVRIPLVLLANFALPKRGPGYLDLARIDDRLREAAGAAGREIELFEDGTRLVPTTGETRLALLSDRSFQSYLAARAHLRGPKLPVDTDLYGNQGFLDAALEYPIKSARANFSVRVGVAPELGQRIKLHLEFLPLSGPARSYDLPASSRRVPLDPRWYEAAWTFVGSGFTDAFAIDRLVFLLCLVVPFRQFWSLLAVVTVLTGLQALTLTANAWGATPDSRLLVPLFDTCLAVAVLLLAIENVVAPSLRRRWLISSVVGVLSGFGFGRLLADEWQFAGAYTLASAVSFNVGIALGEVVALALTFVALGILFTHVTGKRLGVVVLSALLGHMGWHWMTDAAHQLEHAAAAIVSTGSVAGVVWWILVGLLVGGAAWFLPKQFDGHGEDSQRLHCRS
jgi:hypothetical protein